MSVKAQGECQVEDGFSSQSSALMMDDQSPPAGCPCRRHCQGDGTQRVVSVNTQYTHQALVYDILPPAVEKGAGKRCRLGVSTE